MACIRNLIGVIITYINIFFHLSNRVCFFERETKGAENLNVILTKIK